MQIYSALTQFTGSDEEEIEVASQRCRYRLEINDSSVILRGPGVSEVADRDSFQSFESDEDLAILAVILFENGLWPED